MVSREQIEEYQQNELAGVHYLRIYDDTLYAIDVNFTDLAFDLSESDRLSSWRRADGETRYANAPLADVWRYEDHAYRLKDNSAKADSAWAFFDYQSNCVADLYGGNLYVRDFSGQEMARICLADTHPCSGDSEGGDSKKRWENFSDKKAYRFVKVRHDSENGELVSQDECSSLAVYDLMRDSCRIVALSGEYRPILQDTLDVVEGRAYWPVKGSHLACYDTISDELSIVV